MCIRDSIESIQAEGIGGIATVGVVEINPVSYTHLDVYKRQLKAREAAELAPKVSARAVSSRTALER